MSKLSNWTCEKNVTANIFQSKLHNDLVLYTFGPLNWTNDSRHLLRDLIERVDVSGTTKQSLKQDEDKDDPDVTDEVIVDL